MNVSYYPGCSLHGSSREYDVSTQAICRALGIELTELPDWICCGASSGHSLNEALSIGLPAYNLRIAEGIGMDVAVPCAACYNRLKVAEHAMREQKTVQQQMKDTLAYDFQWNVKVLNMVELILDRVGLEAIRAKVVKPLNDIKVACYYGCLLVRPVEAITFDDPDHPKRLDELMEVIGAAPVQWAYKTECCGGSHSLTRDDVVTHLVDGLIAYAREAGAQLIVTACPLCFENLEMRQSEGRFPILYFTELLGLAFGLEESKRWLDKHMVNPKPFLKSVGLI